MIQESLQILAEFKDNASAALRTLIDSLKGVGSQANATSTNLNAVATSINTVTAANQRNASSGAEVQKSYAGINRELLVLAHEASQGAWTRFGGSLLVLGEQTNALSKAFSVLALGGGVVGTSILALGAVVAGVGVNAFIAHEQLKQLNAAMALTNNYAAIGSAQLEVLANRLAGSLLVSSTNAKTALLGIVSTGQYTQDQIKMMGDIIVKQSTLSGVSIEELTKKYAALADQPGKLADEVNKSMHILTPAQQNQVRDLEAVGEKAAAANVVYRALINYFNGPAAAAIKGQSSWIRQMINDYSDLFVKIGKITGVVATSTKEQITNINKELKELTGSEQVEDIYPARYQPKVEALLKARKELYRKAAIDEAQSTKQSADAFVSQKSQESGDFLQKTLGHSGKTLKQALKEFDKMVAQERQYNPTSSLLDTAQLDKARQKIIDGYKDPKVQAVASQAYEAQLATLDGLIKTSADYWKKQGEVAKTQLTKGAIDEVEYAAEVNRIRQGELKDQEQYTQAKVKAASAEAVRTSNRNGVKDREKFAADVKHIQNEEQIANLQYEQQLAQHARTVSGIYNKMILDVNKADAARKTSADRDLAKVTLSQNEAGLADSKNAVVDRFEALRAQVQEQLRVANASTGEVQKAMESLDAAEKHAMENETKYFDERLAATTDWKTGVIKAVKDTQEAAQNAAALMGSFINDLTKSFEDNIFNFLTTGKFSFKDLETSWANTISRMVAKALAAKLQDALFGSMSGATGGTSWVSQGLSALSGLFGAGKAAGGPVNAGTIYPVGENGPELFAPSVGGTIIPNHALQGGGNSTSVHFAITAMDSQSVISAISKHERQIAGIVNNANRSYNLT